MHESVGTASEFQIGDVIWLYTPVVKQGNTKSFHLSLGARTQ